MSSAAFEEVLPTENGSSNAMSKLTCKLEWKVSNFSSISVGQDHFSSYVSSPQQPDFKWCIGLSIQEAGADKYILVFLKPDFPTSNTACSFEYTLSANNSNGQQISEFTVASDVSPNGVLNRTVHRLKFVNVISALSDDSLLLEAELSFVLLPTGGVGGMFLRSLQAGTKLLGDLSVMLGNELFSDVVISVESCSPSVTIPAHQILLSRSSVFRGKLTEDTPEKRDRCIRISDLDVDTVRHMLSYIYTDRFDNSLNTREVIKLLKCSEKYSISGLKSLCELHLIRNINDEVSFKCLVAADLYNAKELKSKALEIICKSRKNMARIKEALNSDVDEVNQEQRLRLLTEILYEISTNFLPN